MVQIEEKTGKKISCVLWLAEEDTVENYYCQNFCKGDFSIDAYDVTDAIVLSDIGYDGKLYGYEKRPLKFLNVIEDDLFELNREEAICLIDGEAYVAEDHQSAMWDYQKNYWENKGLDMEYDWDEAAEQTDKMFRENKIFGFDLYEIEEDNVYLIAHYPQNLMVDDVYEWAKGYANEKKAILATYTDRNKLGYRAREVA